LMGRAVKVSERRQAGDERKNMNMEGQQYSEVARARSTHVARHRWLDMRACVA
jgi:hypothetical protein